MVTLEFIVSEKTEGQTDKKHTNKLEVPLVKGIAARVQSAFSMQELAFLI